MIFFSIIIPVYRDIERLRLCLGRFTEMVNPYFEFEVIVVNNDPENQKIEVESSEFLFPIITLFEPNPGSYPARNRGIKEAKGEILAFTDSDCLPSNNWLLVAYYYFSKYNCNQTGVLTGPVPLFYKYPDSLSKAEVYEKYTGFTTEVYAKEGHTITANWFSPASVIREFGGFNDKLKSNGDSELSGKISQKYKIVYSPKLIVHHPARYHTDELVNKYKRILGGTYERKYKGNHLAFFGHIMNFSWRRYRFTLKKFFTVPIHESWAIFKVCNAINWGAVKEYFSLIRGGETKR